MIEVTDFSGDIDDLMTEQDKQDVLDKLREIKMEPLYGTQEHRDNCNWTHDVILRLIDEHDYLVNLVEGSGFLSK